MVNRPPPRAGSSRGREEGAENGFGPIGSGGSHRSHNGASRRGMEWSLRSLHKIDTGSQHFLPSGVNGDDSDDSVTGEEDQTAYEIFKSKPAEDAIDKHKSVWAALNAPLRTGIVDGRKVVFELRSDVSEKPTTLRKDRVKRHQILQHADKSHPEIRLRFWLMHFGLARLSLAFLTVFIFMNVVFATIFYFLGEDGCCGDPSMTFSNVFAFTVQTSTTIGYGGYVPSGMVSNLFVVILSYVATLVNTLFAGLLFTKFVTPVINIQFSDVMTMCNVNGVPCLSFRVGNADGNENPLTDINVRLTYSYQIPYNDHKGEQKFFRQTEELKLLSDRQHGLSEAWTLRHVLDESSPLFGLHFDQHPGDKIYVFTLSIDAVQELTKSTVNVQTEYEVQDILIGHSFVHMVQLDLDHKTATSDFSLLSVTEPYPVWYPAKSGAYNNDALDRAYASVPVTKPW